MGSGTLCLFVIRKWMMNSRRILVGVFEPELRTIQTSSSLEKGESFLRERGVGDLTIVKKE